MSNTGPYYEPILFISPLLTVTPRVASTSFNDPTNNTGCPTDNTCTCGTYNMLDFIDISLDYQIELPHALSDHGHNFTLIVAYDKPSFNRRTTSDCSLCRALFYNFENDLNYWLPRSILDSLGTKFKEFWAKHAASEAVQQIYSRIEPEHRTWVIGSFSNNAGIYKPKVVPGLCDLNLVKLWIQNCTTEHASCTYEKPVVEGMRLIDCYTQRICEAEPSSRWVALSYVWGLRKSADLPGDIPENPSCLSNAPQTIRDAMAVTSKLGYRYLWVDAYCIDQVHGANKEDQINKMDKIYNGAELTIAATGSDKYSGLPGISTERRSSHEIFRMNGRDILFTGPDPSSATKQSEWWSRGW